MLKNFQSFKILFFHLDHAFFKEKSLPPIEEIPASSTFDFLGQYEEVVRANLGGLNYKGARIPLSNVQISVNLLEERLRAIQYPDLQILDYLKYGWPVGDEEGAGYSWPIQEWRPTATRRNRLSAYANFRFVDKFINKQVAANRIAGPFNLETSPFQGTLPHLVPIKVAETVGKLRVILQTFVLNQHTSSPVYPDGAPAYSRPHIYQFAKVLGRLGPGAWLWKRDLRSFYLQLPLDPRDYPKLWLVGYKDDFLLYNISHQLHLEEQALLPPHFHLGTQAGEQQRPALQLRSGHLTQGGGLQRTGGMYLMSTFC